MATKKQAAEAVEETAKVWTDEELEEIVTVRLPLIPGEKQEALYVGVNGQSWVVPRGKPFELPRYAALVIEQAEAEQLRAMEYQIEAPYKREK